MEKPTNKAERDALIKELQAMTFNELPKRWEEMKELNGYYVNSGAYTCGLLETYCGSNNRNIFPTDPQAEASIYLAMLMQLRDVYREGWTPDWTDVDRKKHCLVLEENKWRHMTLQTFSETFSFQTQERAKLFLENFGDYLEKVKPLFS